MNKCKKCGTEFEGKFCPECGTPWLNEEEKVCPKCNAVLKANAKFCSECGYSFEEQSAPAPEPTIQPAPVAPKPASAHTGSKLLTAYQIVSVLPEALFLLISVLAFIFLAAPATKVTSAGLFLGVMDVGSGYHVISLSGIDGLRNPAIALIVFAALGLAFALLCALFAWKKKKSVPLSFGAFAFYLVYLIIASVMIANTASLDEGLGVLGAGACPVCFLVFSILFAAGHGASLVARNILNKKPEVKEAQAAKEEAEKARREEFYATHQEPVMQTPQTKKGTVIYKYEKRYYDRGKAKTPSAALVFFDMHKVVLGIAAVALTVAIVLMATLIPYFNNKFRVGVAEKISLGDSKEQVADILGEPYGADRISNDWFYYDDALLSYVEKAQDLAQKQEEALAQGNFTRAEQLAQEAKTLQEQMNSKAFKCIEITFADEKVESVLFDTGYSATLQAKEIEKYELLGDVLVGYYEDRTVSPTKYQSVEGTNAAAPYEVHFTDGSYYKTYVKNGTMEVASEGYSVDYTYSWGDKYGNYSEKISNDEAVNIGTIDKDGVWEANGEGIKKLKLSEVIVPEGVTLIKDLSLSSYENLTYNQFGNALYIGSSANPYFILVKAENTAITECQIHTDIKIIYRGAFEDCSALIDIEIPNSVISIGEGIFSGCSNLTSITIPFIGGFLTQPGDNYGYSFGYFFSEKEYYYIPASLENVTVTGGWIMDRAFYGCSKLTNVTIGDGVTSIGEEAFFRCSKLTNVTIGDGVTSIGKQAFYYCEGIENVTIGSSVTSMENGAFGYCSHITSVNIKDLVAWCKIDFGTPESNPLYPQLNPKSLYVRGEEVTDFVTPQGMTEIKNYVFCGCTGLANVTIGSGIKSIGDGAFWGCAGLTSIEIPDSVTEIGYRAFYECTRLTDIHFQGTVEEWQAIEKGIEWDGQWATTPPNYTVTCTDGTVKKDGMVTYF